MQIIVKLFGTLPDKFPGYDPAVGMDVEIPDGASVSDLLVRLGLPDRDDCFVSMNNRIAGPDHKLSHKANVIILQSLAGG